MSIATISPACSTRQAHKVFLRGARVVVVDGQSRHGTRAAARSLELPELQVISGLPTPSGWSGKVWALEQGLEQAVRPFVLLLDADIRLAPVVLFSVGCVSRVHIPYDPAGAIPPDQAQVLQTSPLFFTKAGAPDYVNHVMPGLSTEAHIVRRIQFPSTGDNGQPDNLVTGLNYQSREPGPKRLVIILPIWGSRRGFQAGDTLETENHAVLLSFGLVSSFVIYVRQGGRSAAGG